MYFDSIYYNKYYKNVKNTDIGKYLEKIVKVLDSKTIYMKYSQQIIIGEQLEFICKLIDGGFLKIDIEKMKLINSLKEVENFIQWIDLEIKNYKYNFSDL